ncbi:MAG TPA: YciI family protein [bacterium]|nr:YciI family protein [bacterium]
MGEYLFLYHYGGPELSPQEMQAVMPRWMAWMKDLADKGHVKGLGNPLGATGKVVRGRDKTVTDGPFAEAKDVINGYTLILAQDLAQAAELAKGCPMLEGGGAVEVRPIMQM